MQCKLHALDSEVKSLKGLVTNLSSHMVHVSDELAEAKILINDLKNRNVSYSAAVAGEISSVSALTSASGPSTTPGTMTRETNRRDVQTDDRKFNVVVSGLEECKEGTSRQREDLDKVVSLFNTVDSALSPSSIKYHFRLGKYSAVSKKPRPILVKFVQSADAYSLLSKSGDFRRPAYVKPDLSLNQRKRESVLLRERWSLIESGTPRSSIRIRQSKLFLNNVLYTGLLILITFFLRAECVPCDQDEPSQPTSPTPRVPSGRDVSSHADETETHPSAEPLDQSQVTSGNLSVSPAPSLSDTAFAHTSVPPQVCTTGTPIPGAQVNPSSQS